MRNQQTTLDEVVVFKSADTVEFGKAVILLQHHGLPHTVHLQTKWHYYFPQNTRIITVPPESEEQALSILAEVPSEILIPLSTSTPPATPKTAARLALLVLAGFLIYNIVEFITQWLQGR